MQIEGVSSAAVGKVDPRPESLNAGSCSGAWTTDRLPNPWLIDSEFLLGQLTWVRELVLRVPLTNASYQPVNAVVDALWRLEQQVRYLLALHREGQRAFARKHSKKVLDKVIGKSRVGKGARAQ